MIKASLAAIFLLIANTAMAADPVVRFMGDGVDVVTSRSTARDSIIDLGPGADIIVTGGGRGRNVDVNSGNDRVIDKVYNESLPQFPQADGSVLPWVGQHTIQNGRELGFHTYHLGAGDESRITLPDQNALPANGGYAMRDVRTHGVFIIHGPGSTATPTIIKAFDSRVQRIAMSGTIRVTAVGGVVSGTTRLSLNVGVFYLQGTTNDPGTNGQYVRVDMALLNPSQRMVIPITANTQAAMIAAVQNHVLTRGIVVPH